MENQITSLKAVAHEAIDMDQDEPEDPLQYEELILMGLIHNVLAMKLSYYSCII